MSQGTSKDLSTSSEDNEEGPDYVSFYTSQITELLSKDILLPIAPQPSESNSSNTAPNPLFGNPFGNGLTDFKKSRLQPLLRQTVLRLSKEVDQMLDPVHSIHRIRKHMQSRKDIPSNFVAEASQDDARNSPNKKLKQSSLSSSVSITSNGTAKKCDVSREGSVRDGKNVDSSETEKSEDLGKRCSRCHTMVTSKVSSDPERSLKSLCNTCEQKEVATKEGNSKDLLLEQDVRRTGNELGEVDDDLMYLIEKYPAKVEDTVSFYSDELSETLGSMGKKLEGLLDMVLSCCRKVTITEKQELRNLIQNLPSRNLDHVVEIIEYRKQPTSRKYQIDDEIDVDLEEQDDATLWRLYYYVQAVENAKKLSLQPTAR
ncbi:uncharacterized protein LOC124940083 [Impatiens glandulifera]|uniref:uncharacterized protein LOC124940083 n=1 Tax=Impatiens glandulifera TaxID=253017 RepID=UPI001FB08F70|nr:uncharacterized protein LOC124940083 [Impatiens glandulifera]